MWTQEKTLKLIELWHQLPVLWDAKHKHFRNRDVRKSSLEILAREFDMTPMDIEKKITGLKNQYRREYNKVNFQDPSTFSVEWFGYRPLQFIQSTLFTRDQNSRYDSNFLELKDFELLTSDIPSTSNFVPNIKEEIENEELPSVLKELRENENVVIYNTSTPKTTPIARNIEEQNEQLPLQPVKRHKSQHNNKVRVTPPQMLNIFARVNEDDNFPEIQSNSQNGDSRDQQVSPSTQHSVCSNMSEDLKEPISSHIPEIRDEFSVYAEYVANSLRKFKDQHSVLVAQNKINNILFDGATGMFSLYNSDRRECTSTRRDNNS